MILFCFVSSDLIFVNFVVVVCPSLCFFIVSFIHLSLCIVYFYNYFLLFSLSCFSPSFYFFHQICNLFAFLIVFTPKYFVHHPLFIHIILFSFILLHLIWLYLYLCDLCVVSSISFTQYSVFHNLFWSLLLSLLIYWR